MQHRLYRKVVSIPNKTRSLSLRRSPRRLSKFQENLITLSQFNLSLESMF